MGHKKQKKAHLGFWAVLNGTLVLCCACVALYPTEPEIWFSAEHIWIEETNVDWVDWLDVDMTMTVAGYLDVTIVDHNYLWAVDLDGGLQFSVETEEGFELATVNVDPVSYTHLTLPTKRIV